MGFSAASFDVPARIGKTVELPFAPDVSHGKGVHMKKPPIRLYLLAATLVAGLIWIAAPAVAQEDTEARKARILANLKLQYPQLEQASVTMGDIVPTEYEGFEQGSFNIAGRGAQKFLISKDDKTLYLVGDPVDVSKSEAQIQVLVAEREAAKAREAEERIARLNEAIAGLPTRGNPNAPVTIVEFSDFQCPYCSRGANTVEQILEKYPEDVKFVFKHFPLGFHNWAKPAAIASHCAGIQDADAFWTLHDKYFEAQKALNAGNVMAKSKGFLEGANIDLEKWSTCAEKTESAEYKAASAAVDADMALGKQLGVSGTPGFFVNGHFLNGAQPISSFEPLIQKAKTTGS
jgi:protein-disulfide isomerase